MGAKNTKPVSGKMSEETRITYYKAEFSSMGDVLRDGRLNQQEFLRLMILLGLPDANRAAEVLWNKQTKTEMCKMTLEEYVALMMDPDVDSKTNMWRKLFARFDVDGSGYASKKEVMQGLEDLGIPVGEEMRNKIQAMDCDKDNQIHYGDFLKMQLLSK